MAGKWNRQANPRPTECELRLTQRGAVHQVGIWGERDSQQMEPPAPLRPAAERMARPWPWHTVGRWADGCLLSTSQGHTGSTRGTSCHLLLSLPYATLSKLTNVSTSVPEDTQIQGLGQGVGGDRKAFSSALQEPDPLRVYSRSCCPGCLCKRWRSGAEAKRTPFPSRASTQPFGDALNGMVPLLGPGPQPSFKIPGHQPGTSFTSGLVSSSVSHLLGRWIL